jgi:polar amino acid transport system substrate-binding protein
MNFSALIPALVSGKQDIIASAVNITAERQKSIDFSDPYFICNTIICIRNENSEGYTTQTDNAKSQNFFQTIKRSIQRNIIEEDRYLMILDGLKVTALIALLAALFGTLLGAVICWMRMSKSAALRLIANVYISIMRGMPVLVLLMIMFYVVFAGTSVGAVAVSVSTFGQNFAAYVSEMFRSAIESVDRGQTEAGIALGFTPVKTFYHIIMPQAFKQVLPVYKGELISLVKMTSIVGYIAVQDLTKIGDIIRSRTFDAFFPLIMVAVLYFVLSWLFTVVLDFIGKKAR